MEEVVEEVEVQGVLKRAREPKRVDVRVSAER